MQAVAFEVEQVVGDLDRRGAQTERGKSQQQRQPGRTVAELVRGQGGHEEQQVFEPLMHAQHAPQGTYACGLRREGVLYLCDALRFLHECRVAVDHDGFARLGPQGQVGRGVACVVEAPLAETFAQGLRFVCAGDVGAAVAGDDFIEQAQMVGNGLRDGGVCGSAQHEFAACGALALQPFEQRLVVGQCGGVEAAALRHVALEHGFAPCQQERQPQQLQLRVAHQAQRAFVQHVSVDQRAVEVDDERRRHVILLFHGS